MLQTAEDEVQRLQGTLMAMDQVLGEDIVGFGGITRAFSSRRALKSCCPCALTSGVKCEGVPVCDTGQVETYNAPMILLNYVWKTRKSLIVAFTLLPFHDISSKVMRALRGQNAGERERLRQEHLRMETLQVRRFTLAFLHAGSKPLLEKDTVFWCA